MEKRFILKIFREQIEDILTLDVLFFSKQFTRAVIPRLSRNVPHFLAYSPLKVNSPFDKKKILVESYPTGKAHVAIKVGKSFVSRMRRVGSKLWRKC